MGRLMQTLALGAAISISLTSCSIGITEPLSANDLDRVSSWMEKPSAYSKLSLKSSSDFQESYGDQERIDPTFENQSQECSAVADIERVTRFAPGGNDFRRLMPAALREFKNIGGLHWSLKTSEEAAEYSFALVHLALLSFDSEEEALTYSSLVRENVEPCFDFRNDSGSLLQTYELLQFSDSEVNDKDFYFEYTDYLEGTLLSLDINIVIERAIAVYHFGPNVAIVHAASEIDSSSLLGIKTSDLVQGFAELREVIEESMTNAQESVPSNATL